MMKLRIKPDPKIKNFLWPKYKTGGAAAFDLYLQEDISLRPGESSQIFHPPMPNARQISETRIATTRSGAKYFTITT